MAWSHTILQRLKLGMYGMYCHIQGKEQHDCQVPGLPDQEVAKLSKSTKIVLALLKSQLNIKGYVLGMYNFYASVELYGILLANGTDAISTVRFNRKGLSEVVKEKKLKKGEIITRFNNKVLHMKWRDKKYVNMLSTIYDDDNGSDTIWWKRSKQACCLYQVQETAHGWSRPYGSDNLSFKYHPQRCYKVLQEDIFQAGRDESA